ncbi:hypothetical protein TEA_017611 [Camellia sinensis var. sinensis]|uniref:RHOMBOID-like protein n=1 Tax=Camellia sinensis var. sinensis TaxID=542762 RepID=A0A4S4CVM0_CAMSN|nr:hypothetical protein TEA_017611 [Camellia sinensis var. sinensis]
MAGEPPPEIQIKVRSQRSGNVIHPADVESPPPPASAVKTTQNSIVYQEIKQSKKWFSWLIPSFVVANIVMFVITMFVNDCPKSSGSCVAGFLGRFSFQPFKENPLLGPSSSTLQKMGALDVSKVVHGHQQWRLITCIWLHAGVFHLLANMLSLVVIGIRLEQEFGFVRIGLLYLISGFGGSLLSGLFIQYSISVGASGALFGLLGGMLSELITNWTIYANKVAALVTLVIIIVINLAVGILPHVDNFAHIGGFFSGFLLGFTVGLVLLLRGVNANDRCSWCHYLSCIPTSKWSCNSQPVSCMSEQLGNQVTLTCSNTGKNVTYTLANHTASQLQNLCSQLCS